MLGVSEREAYLSGFWAGMIFEYVIHRWHVVAELGHLRCAFVDAVQI